MSTTYGIPNTVLSIKYIQSRMRQWSNRQSEKKWQTRLDEINYIPNISSDTIIKKTLTYNKLFEQHNISQNTTFF